MSGVALIVSLFLPWYTLGGSDANAWESMSVDDILLALTGLGGVAAAVAAAARPGTAVPIHYIVLASIGGLLAVVLVVWRVIDPAPPADVGIGAGAWLGLAAALGLAAGALRGAADEGPARRDVARERVAAQAGIERSERLALPGDSGMEAE